MSAVHVFDVDHTLVRTSTAFGFLMEGLRTGRFSLWKLLHIPFHLRRYRSGKIRDGILEREIPFVKGRTRQELLELCAGAFERSAKPSLFVDAIRLIESLREQGARIILATSSVDTLVEPIARFLGADELISSRLVYEGDVATGFLDAGAVFGSRKLDLVLGRLRDDGIDPSDCTFYSDSSFDLPLLEAVGVPVAVNPDARLEAVAAERGWRILRFRKTLGRKRGTT